MNRSGVEEQKRIEAKIIQNIRNLFKLIKENQAIKDRTIRDNRNHYEHEEEKDYHKPVRLGNF